MHSGWIWNQQVSLLFIKFLHRTYYYFLCIFKNEVVGGLEVGDINAIFIATIYFLSADYVVGT